MARSTELGVRAQPGVAHKSERFHHSLLLLLSLWMKTVQNKQNNKNALRDQDWLPHWLSVLTQQGTWPELEVSDWVCPETPSRLEPLEIFFPPGGCQGAPPHTAPFSSWEVLPRCLVTLCLCLSLSGTQFSSRVFNPVTDAVTDMHLNGQVSHFTQQPALGGSWSLCRVGDLVPSLDCSLAPFTSPTQ